MAFRLSKKCRDFFQYIYDKENKDGTKLRLLFDEYYLCLMVGLASGTYEENAQLELPESSREDAAGPEVTSSEITDSYPEDYIQSRDFIAGLLIATERKRRGIPESDSAALEKLMTRYLNPESRTRISPDGEKRLNQYAAQGLEILMDVMAKPYELDTFLIEYLECFERNQFNMQG